MSSFFSRFTVATGVVLTSLFLWNPMPVQAVANCHFTCYHVQSSAGDQATADARTGATGATPQQCQIPVAGIESAAVTACTQASCQAACDGTCHSLYANQQGRCLLSGVSMARTGDCPVQGPAADATITMPTCDPVVAAGGSSASSAIPAGPYDPFAGKTIPTVINTMIKFLLGFVGILALGTFVWGGFIWMTAAGDTKKIHSATTILRNGMFGFIFVLLAYGILSSFLGLLGGLNALPQDTTREVDTTGPAAPASTPGTPGAGTPVPGP